MSEEVKSVPETIDPVSTPATDKTTENLERLRQVEIDKYNEQQRLKLELEKHKQELEELKKGRLKHMEEEKSVLLKEITAIKETLAQERQEKDRLKELKEVIDIVKTDDNFELIRAYEAEENVLEFINAHKKDTGVKLSYKEAAEKLEKYYEDLEDKRLNALKNTKKGSKWYQSSQTGVSETKSTHSEVKTKDRAPDPSQSKEDTIEVQKLTRDEYLHYLKNKYLTA